MGGKRHEAGYLSVIHFSTEIVENGKKYIQIAWPEGRLFDEKGNFSGFVMPEVDLVAATEVSNIIQRSKRRNKGLPEFYGSRVLLAANLSAPQL